MGEGEKCQGNQVNVKEWVQSAMGNAGECRGTPGKWKGMPGEHTGGC